MGQIFQAAGQSVGAIGSLVEADAHKANRAALRMQARETRSEGYRDEEAQRRDARQFFGMQAAAMADAGGGVGGSNELLIRQSAALAELDALNIRYGALQRGRKVDWAVMQEGTATKMSYLRAGAQFLSAAGTLMGSSGSLGS